MSTVIMEVQVTQAILRDQERFAIQRLNKDLLVSSGKEGGGKRNNIQRGGNHL